MHKLKYKKYFESGQTLIETMSAVFILIMGVTSALGLAIYANSSSTMITKQIIATGLAREGVESVKNMRDVNWLKQLAIDKDCYNYASSTPGGIGPAPATCPGSPMTATCCYRKWLEEPGCAGEGNDKGFCIRPGVPPTEKNYSLRIQEDPSKKNWTLSFPGDTTLYLYNGSDWDALAFDGLYKDSNSPGYSPSGFYRQITLSTLGSNSTGLYDPGSFSGLGPRLEVTSRVWWTDKKCPVSAVWPGYGKCSVEIKGYLTNWKNY